MLDSKIIDFAKRLIQADTKKRQRPFLDKLSQNERELQLSGNSPDSSSRGKRRIRNFFTEELEDKASVVWESLQRAHKALGSQITDTLACDLKENATQFLCETKKGLLELMIKRPYFAKDDTANSTLDSAKNDACEKINIEIDLYVNSLTNKPADRKATIAAIIISFMMILLFELLVHVGPLSWFNNHPNSYSLQGSIICLIPCLLVGLFKRQWRKWCWGVAGLAFLGIVLSLLGGRSRQ